MRLYNKRHKVLVILSIILILLSNSYCMVYAYNNTFEVEAQTAEFYINDFANLFTKTQKDEMMNKAVQLNDNYDGIQVVVTTVNSLNGKEIEEYAYYMYNQYDIGNDSMGVLILLSTTDIEIRIETGYNMQKYFTDAISGSIIDKYGMDYLKKDDFANAIISIQSDVIEQIKENVPKDWNIQNRSSNSLPHFIVTILVTTGTFLLIYAICIVVKNFKDKKQNEIESRINNEIAQNNVGWRSLIEGQKEQYENQLKINRERIDDLTKEKKILRDKVSVYDEKLNRINKLYPNVEEDLENMIKEEYKQEAKAFDLSVKDVICLPIDRKNVSTFKKAVERYARLSDEVKHYVETWPEIGDKYIECNKKQEEYLYNQKITVNSKKVKRVHDVIKKFVDSNLTGSHKNFYEAREVWHEYLSLDDFQLSMIKDKEILEKLKKVFYEAKEDYENYQKAKSVEMDIENVIDSIRYPERDDIDELKSAKKLYLKLTNKQKEYFPKELYDKLLAKLKEAEDDDENFSKEFYDKLINEYEKAENDKVEKEVSTSQNEKHINTGNGGTSGGGGASNHF